MAAPTSELDQLLRQVWHPVCTLDELAAAAPGGVGPLGVALLGERLAVAMVDGVPVALRDRCVHRSTALSVGTVDGGGIRCAYHGWVYAADGRCIDIPALAGGPIPARACVESFASTVAYGLVWVCLDNRAALPLPACPPYDDPTLRIIAGDPYTWPVAASRRVENFVDLSHFAFVHDGSHGTRDEPVPALPDIERAPGELRFVYDPPDIAVEPRRCSATRSTDADAVHREHRVLPRVGRSTAVVEDRVARDARVVPLVLVRRPQRRVGRA